MNSKDFRNLTEAYSNIYEEEQDLLGFQDEDYEAIMTELVEELLDEGYELEESLDITEECFLDYIEEASVTFGHDTRGMRTPEERRTAAKANEWLAVEAVLQHALPGGVRELEAGSSLLDSIANDELRLLLDHIVDMKMMKISLNQIQTL